jgi:hypothetical protein
MLLGRVPLLFLLGTGCANLIGANFDDTGPLCLDCEEGVAGGGAASARAGAASGTASAGVSGGGAGAEASGAAANGAAGTAGASKGGRGGAGAANGGRGSSGPNTSASMGGASGASGEGSGGDGSDAGGGGEAGADEPTLLGGPAPGKPRPLDYQERPYLGYYETLGPDVGAICVEQGPECQVFGLVLSLPFSLGAPAPCGTHGLPTEFAGFGTVLGLHWYPSPTNYHWDFGLDEKYSSEFGAHAPLPASWNGVLVAYENGEFSVDWEKKWWREPSTVRRFPFNPNPDSPSIAYPVIGRWRREYGERLGLYQDGTFYLDWDGDNAWDSGHDRSYFFGVGVYPFAGDFKPGGGDEVGTYEDGTWFIDYDGTGAFESAGDVEWSFSVSDRVHGSMPVLARDGWRRDCVEDADGNWREP